MPPTPRRIRRVALSGALILSALGAGYLFLRYGLEDVPGGYSVLEPHVHPGSTALVDRWFHLGGDLTVGQMISFRLDDGGGVVRRYGRVAAVAGSRFEEGPEGLVVDGVPGDLPPPADVALPATVPDGSILVVYNAARGEGDTRATAVVPVERVLARVLLEVTAAE